MNCMTIPISIEHHPIEEDDCTGLKYIFFKEYAAARCPFTRGG
jgi:hypothetical protein